MRLFSIAKPVLLAVLTLSNVTHATQNLYRNYENSNCEPEQLCTITDNSLKKLFLTSYHGIELYITKQELIGTDNQSFDLKNFFDKHHIALEPSKANQEQLSKKAWAAGVDRIIQRSKHQEKANQINLNDLSQWLIDAKMVLISFLIPDDNQLLIIINQQELPLAEQQWIKKSKALRRLFTYAQIQRVIDHKKLSHIHLPRKVLAILDRRTNQYVSYKHATEIINEILKVFAQNVSSKIRVTCAEHSSDYELVVFAHKKTRSTKKLNPKALDDLKTLCLDAPFDVGFDNIFSNDHGDAVIIDTEYLGEVARDCIPKLLGRYRGDMRR